jgi:hypothetical protein
MVALLLQITKGKIRIPLTGRPRGEEKNHKYPHTAGVVASNLKIFLDSVGVAGLV